VKPRRGRARRRGGIVEVSLEQFLRHVKDATGAVDGRLLEQQDGAHGGMRDG
jgi:hypothetical protein